MEMQSCRKSLLRIWTSSCPPAIQQRSAMSWYRRLKKNLKRKRTVYFAAQRSRGYHTTFAVNIVRGGHLSSQAFSIHSGKQRLMCYRYSVPLRKNVPVATNRKYVIPVRERKRRKKNYAHYFPKARWDWMQIPPCAGMRMKPKWKHFPMGNMTSLSARKWLQKDWILRTSRWWGAFCWPSFVQRWFPQQWTRFRFADSSSGTFGTGHEKGQSNHTNVRRRILSLHLRLSGLCSFLSTGDFCSAKQCFIRRLQILS